MRTEGPTQRVLRLLGLLQRRPSWTAAEIAAELNVTDRSVRRDVERLRSLGYPVRAAAGVGGGYQLGAGSRIPPLLLDDEEAVAVGLSLRLAAGGTVAGAEEAALSALTKLDRMMPPLLRAEVRALHSATGSLVGPSERIGADTLLLIAQACREAVRVRFQYADRDGAETSRSVEPVQMITTGQRWYLMAYDVDRQDWRTFRLDRMHQLETTAWRFRPRDHPDPAQYVQDSVTAAPYRYVARVRLRTAAEEIGALIPPQVGRVEEGQDGWCLLIAGADDLDWLALHVARLGYEAQILEPAALKEAAKRLGQRLTALADS